MARVKNDVLDKLIKDGLLKWGNDPALEIHRIPTGIAQLDTLLGGGLPLGKIIELYGPESTGKTLIAQYIATAIQAQEEKNQVLLMDMEDSYDPVWWGNSGVDTEKLLVSAPATAEQAIDIMRGLLAAPNVSLGLIILDSIAGLVPMPEMDPDRSSEEKTMGLQAKVITLMFRQIKSLLGDTVLLMTNQMRDSIGPYTNELSSLPGGRANRHFCHILWRTNRESWINDGKVHIGFNMEITSRKNKLATVADGDSVVIPVTFANQIDATWAFVDAAIEEKVITRGGSFYYWKDQRWQGKTEIRAYFIEEPTALEELKASVGAGSTV